MLIDGYIGTASTLLIRGRYLIEELMIWKCAWIHSMLKESVSGNLHENMDKK